MRDVTPIETEGGGGDPSYMAMPKAELEALAIAAIREHRALLAADEVVYEEWTRANDDPATAVSVLKSLQDEYLARQKKSEAQQRELSEIIDALGYVPEVPSEDELK
jgi:TraR antiactivator